MNTLAKYRERHNLTQSQVASSLHVDKSYISRVENGQREMTAAMTETAFTNIDDGHTLTDLLHEFSKGFSVPAHSNHIYDDHRMSIKHRMKREILELKEALHDHCLDKHPAHLTQDEKDIVSVIYSEAQDVMFEVHSFLNRLSADYPFINPQQMNKNRDRRLKMKRRI